MGYRWDRYYIMYLSWVLCNIVSVSMFFFVLGGVGGTRYLFQVPCGYLFD